MPGLAGRKFEGEHGFIDVPKERSKRRDPKDKRVETELNDEQRQAIEFAIFLANDTLQSPELESHNGRRTVAADRKLTEYTDLLAALEGKDNESKKQAAIIIIGNAHKTASAKLKAFADKRIEYLRQMTSKGVGRGNIDAIDQYARDEEEIAEEINEYFTFLQALAK